MKKILSGLVILVVIFAAFLTISRSSGAQSKESGEKRISPEAAKQIGASAEDLTHYINKNIKSKMKFAKNFCPCFNAFYAYTNDRIIR